METRWTYEVLLHDMFGAASYWYRDSDPKSGTACVFASPEMALQKAREIYPDNEARVVSVDER